MAIKLRGSKLEDTLQVHLRVLVAYTAALVYQASCSSRYPGAKLQGGSKRATASFGECASCTGKQAQSPEIGMPSAADTSLCRSRNLVQNVNDH